MPTLNARDALLIVDVQNDFCPGGSLAVPEGHEVVPVLNDWIARACEVGAPVVASRDWHPAQHVSFRERGGPWPAHCVQGTEGAAFHPDLELPDDATIISKGVAPHKDNYSAFDDTNLTDLLRNLEVRRVWIGGLALDVCVRATATDAAEAGFEPHLIRDATRGLSDESNATALREMREAGAVIEKGAPTAG